MKISAHAIKMAVLIPAASILVCACGGPLVMVKTAKDKTKPEVLECKSGLATCDLPGIPFYPVRYRCVHDTQWLEPIALVTLSITATDEKSHFTPIAATKVLNFDDLLGNAQQGKIRKLLALVQQTPKTDDYASILKDFMALQDSSVVPQDMPAPTFPSTPESLRFVLAANSLAAERYVDSSTVYYFNGSRPWAGSASVEADVNPDGTLSKGSAQMESKTAETILSLLPFADVIEGVLSVASTDLAPPPVKKPPEPKYALALKIDNKIYKVQKTAQVTDSGAVPPCAPVFGYAGNGTERLISYSFSEVTSAATPPAKGDDSKASTDSKRPN
jgi:hypothetical protein